MPLIVVPDSWIITFGFLKITHEPLEFYSFCTGYTGVIRCTRNTPLFISNRSPGPNCYAMKFSSYLILLSVLVFHSCHDRDKNGRIQSTPISGYIKIAADESLRPIVEAEVATFNAIYTKAHIEALYMSESEVMDELMKDSVRVVVLGRDRQSVG